MQFLLRALAAVCPSLLNQDDTANSSEESNDDFTCDSTSNDKAIFCTEKKTELNKIKISEQKESYSGLESFG